jgi:hypothetical protein
MKHFTILNREQLLALAHQERLAHETSAISHIPHDNNKGVSPRWAIATPSKTKWDAALAVGGKPIKTPRVRAVLFCSALGDLTNTPIPALSR